MKCLNCGKYLIEEVTYLNIFKKSFEHICKSCFYKYDHINRLEVIPSINATINMITLFKGKHLRNYQSLANFLSPYYLYWINGNDLGLLIISDKIDYNLLNLLAHLDLGDIYYLIIFETTNNDYF